MLIILKRKVLMARKKSKNNAIIESELFAEISKRSNFMPEVAVKEVYYGILKTIVGELRKGREVILPGLGKFSIAEVKQHKRTDISTGQVVCIENLRKLTFSGCTEIKKYINDMIIKD